jgi:hypothetical protein
LRSIAIHSGPTGSALEMTGWVVCGIWQIELRTL